MCVYFMAFDVLSVILGSNKLRKAFVSLYVKFSHCNMVRLNNKLGLQLCVCVFVTLVHKEQIIRVLSDFRGD